MLPCASCKPNSVAARTSTAALETGYIGLVRGVLRDVRVPQRAAAAGVTSRPQACPVEQSWALVWPRPTAFSGPLCGRKANHDNAGFFAFVAHAFLRTVSPFVATSIPVAAQAPSQRAGRSFGPDLRPFLDRLAILKNPVARISPLRSAVFAPPRPPAIAPVPRRPPLRTAPEPTFLLCGSAAFRSSPYEDA